MSTDNSVAGCITVDKVIHVELPVVTFQSNAELVEAICCGDEGWFPDKDDTVRVFSLDGMLCVEPYQWKNFLSEEEKESCARSVLRDYEFILEQKRLLMEERERKKANDQKVFFDEQGGDSRTM